MTIPPWITALRTILSHEIPPGLLPSRQSALNNSSLNNVPRTITSYEITPGQLPPGILNSRQLLLNDSHGEVPPPGQLPP